MKRLLAMFAGISVPLAMILAFGLTLRLQGERVPVLAQYEQKLVYDASFSDDTQPLQKDCAKRGGVFFASTCPECAPRCEFAADEAILVPGWDVFDDADIGVKINYPKGMAVQKNRPTEVSLLMPGPTQRQSGLISDGLSMRISRQAFPPALSFDEYVEQRLRDAQAAGLEILSADSFTQGRLSGQMYRTFDSQVTTHVLIPAGATSAVVVEYTLADPRHQDFAALVDRMLSSLRLNARFARL